MLLDPAIFSTATIINDQSPIDNFKSSLRATRPGIRGEGDATVTTTPRADRGCSSGRAEGYSYCTFRPALDFLQDL